MSAGAVTLLAIVRVIHILGGIIWAGYTIVIAAMVVPKLAPAAGREFGQYMVQRGTRTVGIAAALTVLSGIYLMATLHRHDDTAMGKTLGLGGILAILAGIVSGAVGGAAGRKLAKLQPGPENQAQATALRARMQLGNQIAAGLLTLSVICMAIARYV
jgi:uncharacterized membrane protein